MRSSPVVTWSVLPDLAAVGLLAAAFSSVARRNDTQVSRIWLIGWLMIAVHFGALLFQNITGFWGNLSVTIALAALTWAGLLFMWASVTFREDASCRAMLWTMLAANTAYVALTVFAPKALVLRDISAGALGLLPVSITLSTRRSLNHTMRWVAVGLYSALSAFLLVIHHKPGADVDLSIDAVLFTVFAGCCAYFWFTYRRATAGAFITISGFFAWAMVFVVAPAIQAFAPSVAVEGEVWNLPKYIVAVGMILLLLENQIEHNEYLALHDHLTGLPNRRLYQDRLSSALERAKRSEKQAALLVIDLDYFKQVNDTLGHHVGDQVLQRVGELFALRVRRSDTVARTGGDEFSVILEEPTSRNEAALVGRSLVDLLKDPLQIGEHTIQIGASVGVAIYPEDAREIKSLCIAADLHMYHAKHDARSEQHPAPRIGQIFNPVEDREAHYSSSR